MTVDKSRKIYDFFYLDFERVRSYSAQLFGGVLESTTSESKTGGEIKGGVPVIGGGVNYYKSESETKSLHHKLYLNVEKELTDMDKVYFLNDISESITAPFVKFNSSLQILDYKDICNKISDIYDLSKALNAVTNDSKQVNIGIGKKDIRGIVDVMKKLYGDTMKIQFIKENNLLTQSTLQPELIQHGFTELITNQKSVIKNEWITLAQVIQKEEISSSDDTSGLSLSQIDEGILKLLEAFSGIEDILNSKTKLNIIPIAIYREL